MHKGFLNTNHPYCQTPRARANYLGVDFVLPLSQEQQELEQEPTKI